SVETDVHLTRDGVPVLCHDPVLTEPVYALLRPQAPPPSWRPPVAALTLAELRCYAAAGNPHPAAFPDQDPGVTPLALHFAHERPPPPPARPPLADLSPFAPASAGEGGRRAGKTDAQRARAAALRFDLELKRVPFHPERIGDDFDGERLGRLERRVLEEVRAA